MKNYKINATYFLRNSKVDAHGRSCDTFEEAKAEAIEIQEGFYLKAKRFGLDLSRDFTPVTIREVATGREWELDDSAGYHFVPVGA